MKRSRNDPSPGFHRAFWLVLAGFFLPSLNAQTDRYRPAPIIVKGGQVDQAEGARILHQFRQTGVAGTYWLAFELRVLPRKGEERVVKGELFGTPGESGPLTRLSLDGKRWLIQAGPHPAAWISENGETARSLSALETLQPLAGTDVTIFDLQMPFLQWTDFVFEGVANARSRPADSFVLYPPADLVAVQPDLTGVRVLLDTVYQSLVEAELLGAKGATTQSISLLDLKKVGEQWIPKAFDVRNHVTRDKTRFFVTAAALDLKLPADVFSPAQLSAPPPEVPTAAIVRF